MPPEGMDRTIFFHKNFKFKPISLKRLACNRRDLSSSLLHPHYAEAHTQHNKKVDRHQSGKMKKTSYFINGASHKHCNYIFVSKRNFFYKSGVRFEIWTLLFFMASFDLRNLGGQMENLKFYCGFLCGKKGRFWCTFK